MSASIDPVAQLDQSIGVAYTDLGNARARFAADPSGQAVTECEAAEAKLNELLDLRLSRSGKTPKDALHHTRIAIAG